LEAFAVYTPGLCHVSTLASALQVDASLRTAPTRFAEHALPLQRILEAQAKARLGHGDGPHHDWPTDRDLVTEPWLAGLFLVPRGHWAPGGARACSRTPARRHPGGGRWGHPRDGRARPPVTAAGHGRTGSCARADPAAAGARGSRGP
jgi:hypothetical protein